MNAFDIYSINSDSRSRSESMSDEIDDSYYDIELTSQRPHPPPRIQFRRLGSQHRIDYIQSSITDDTFEQSHDIDMIPNIRKYKSNQKLERYNSLSELEANLHKQVSLQIPQSTSISSVEIEDSSKNMQNNAGYIQYFYYLFITPCYCVSSIPIFRSCLQFMTKDFEIIEFNLNHLMEDTESKLTITQRSLIYTKTAFEIYRIIISSLLVVFVPQQCGDHPCSILENTVPENSLEYAAISFNFILAAYFYILYFIEIKRETIINEYLLYDRNMPTDKGHLQRMLGRMDSKTKKQIMEINLIYRGVGRFLILIFLLNLFLSGVVCYYKFLNNTTLITYTTNSLFMVTKLFRVLRITSSGEYVIYSAYRNDNLIYNRDRQSFLMDIGELDDIDIEENESD